MHYSPIVGKDGDAEGLEGESAGGIRMGGGADPGRREDTRADHPSRYSLRHLSRPDKPQPAGLQRDRRYLHGSPSIRLPAKGTFDGSSDQRIRGK